MTDLDEARRLVATLMIDERTEVDDVRPDGTAALVRSGTWTWRVEPAPVSLANTAVVVYDVALDLMSDPGPQPTGFALHEGRIYRLSENPGIDEFWRSVGPTLDCLDLVTLIVRYHPGGSGEHLVKSDDTLEKVVGPRVARTIDGVGAPVCTTDERGTLNAVDFHTWRLHPNLKVSVHRWHVVVGTAGLMWDVEAVAGELAWRVGG